VRFVEIVAQTLPRDGRGGLVAIGAARRFRPAGAGRHVRGALRPDASQARRKIAC
jgi:hypothetical protein